MRFNLALIDVGIRPEEVAIVLHTTNLPVFRKVLPWLVENRPDLFDAYQSVHSDTATATLRKRHYAASFVPGEKRDMIFAGLFRVAEVRDLPTAEIYADPRIAELARDFGAVDMSPDQNVLWRSHQACFTLELSPLLRELRGRLAISSPPGRTYTRLAEKLDPIVTAIYPETVFARPLPDWRELVLSSAEVRVLPARWHDRLAEWRGIYLILDSADGGRYVGAAYGKENLAGRWMAHVSGEFGVTVGLRTRDVSNLRFSILERVSPDMPVDEVIALENSWKRRLHTLDFGLNRQ
jgi:hypothetical protein